VPPWWPGHPEHPIPPGIWGGAPLPPDQAPSVPPPVFNPDDMPDHPELPDLNRGWWMYIVYTTGVYKAAFVPWVLSVSNDMYDPQEPPEDIQPGEWVTILLNNRATWAWIPSEPSGTQAAPATRATKAASSSSS
jgi:hypothetical protein